MYKDANYYTMYRVHGIWNYSCYDETGKRLQRSTGRRKRAEALSVINERILSGHLHYPRGYTSKIKNDDSRKNFITFDEFTKNFFIHGECPMEKSIIARGGHVSADTLYGKRNLFDNLILPCFSGIRLRDITPSMCDQFILSLTERFEIKRSSANKAFSIFSQILKYAVSVGYLEVNPAKDIKLLTNDSERKEVPTIEEYHKLMSLEWDAPIMKLIIDIAANTGMRLGEILALKPYKLKNGSILVNANYARLEKEKDTKTGNIREIPLPPQLYSQMIKYMGHEDAFIFSRTGKKPFSPVTVRKALSNALEKAGIEKNITPHSFRYFFNSRLVAEGVSGEIVRAVIGHEEEEMTDHYLHLTASDLDSIRKVQEKIAR